ncbi:CbtB domain-containing protein [Pseudomonas massiliensis]|uniref:CbtB domain-containing protein n=1 Tax=Pseudomonas massiliensis TaxID=522492 RepID=UPI00058C0B09|nr:CbtB-domain containing protein [Pseudomonas massiliensis]
MTTRIASHTQSQPAVALSARITTACVAGVLGMALVYFAGFSHIPAVHNAAHDTRHSAAFPCH